MQKWEKGGAANSNCEFAQVCSSGCYERVLQQVRLKRFV